MSVAQIKAMVDAMGTNQRVRIADNDIQLVDGFGPDGSNCDRLREMLKTATFGMLPLLKGPLHGALAVVQ